jgi:hypothetical protein
MIRPVVWEEFVKKMSTEEAKAKGENFKELAKVGLLDGGENCSLM